MLQNISYEFVVMRSLELSKYTRLWQSQFERKVNVIPFSLLTNNLLTHTTGLESRPKLKSVYTLQKDRYQ